MDNSFDYSGYLISKGNILIKVRGEFDTCLKESATNPESIFILTNIIFQNKSFLKCKVSSNDERFKRVDSFDFIFDTENNCYLTKVFSKVESPPASIEPIETDLLIKKDLDSKEEIGVLFLRITSTNLLKYESSKERYEDLLKDRSKRIPIS